MRRTCQYAQSAGIVKCSLPAGGEIEIPVVQGILKHLPQEALYDLLKDHRVLRKYTIEAIRKASWHVLRLFPRPWLLACMDSADIEQDRRRALEFMLS